MCEKKRAAAEEKQKVFYDITMHDMPFFSQIILQLHSARWAGEKLHYSDLFNLKQKRTSTVSIQFLFSWRKNEYVTAALGNLMPYKTLQHPTVYL